MGEKGLGPRRKGCLAEIGIVWGVVSAFTKIIICEMAVLNESDSMSSVTFLVVACRIFRCALVRSTSCTAGDNSHWPAWFSDIINRQTRAGTRALPSTPRRPHGFVFCAGPL